MATTPPPIDQFTGAKPQRGDRSTFSARVDAFVTWLIAAVVQLPALALNVYNNALEAFTSATTATSAAAAAMATANAVPWVSGTTYQQYANVISPADGFTYRRRTSAGSGTTDPSLDPTNWGAVQPSGFVNMVVITTTQNWPVPQGVTKVKVTVQAGGSGGNGARSDVSAPGQGGPSGGLAIAIVSGLAGKTLLCTVGLGGAGGVPNTGSWTAGVGGVTSVAIVNGATVASATGGSSGNGGTGTVGDVLLKGVVLSGTSLGAQSLLNPYGAGGNGGSFSNGAAGQSGVVIIEY